MHGWHGEGGREGPVRRVAGKSSVDGNNNEIGVVRLARLNAEGVELELVAGNKPNEANRKADLCG